LKRQLEYNALYSFENAGNLINCHVKGKIFPFGSFLAGQGSGTLVTDAETPRSFAIQSTHMDPAKPFKMGMKGYGGFMLSVEMQ